jgi:DNA-binding CsgD family transcriptional regulator
MQLVTMATHELSSREEQIVELCVAGLTNEAIAKKLDLSMGSVNTYWLRIKLKVGGLGRTDTAVRVIKDRAERALREANVDRAELAEIVAEKERGVIELRAALALLHLAMDQIRSVVWATDRQLTIQIMANGEFTSVHHRLNWEVGKTIFEVFKASDQKDAVVAAHLSALAGAEVDARLEGELSKTFLRVVPLADEAGDVIGCIGIFNCVGPWAAWDPRQPQELFGR